MPFNYQANNNGGVIGSDVPVSRFRAENIEQFTGNGTFTPSGNPTADILIIGGGASGPQQHGSGGGAGGILFAPSFTVPGSPVAITVGGGGAGVSGPNDLRGNQGQNSTFGPIFTALGGGFGGAFSDTNPIPPAHPRNGNTGGSGGGGGSSNAGFPAGTGGTSIQQPSSTPPSALGYGNSGAPGPGGFSGGGGGGGNANASGLNGGAGKAFDTASPTASPSPTTFAGGGGGKQHNSTTGTGGAGGGGPGAGGSGTINSGGGGGSNNAGPTTSGTGGSGKVIIKELGSAATASGVWTLQAQYGFQKNSEWPT